MARYIINDEVFDTRKAKKIIEYKEFYIIANEPKICTLYRTKKNKWVEIEKVPSTFGTDIYGDFCDDDYVKKLLQEHQKIRLYEKYFGKLKAV